jgi:hypothetical protein
MEIEMPEISTAEKERESLKLTKNSRGYNWEIRIFPKKDQQDNDWIKRIEVINNEMLKRYGPQGE